MNPTAGPPIPGHRYVWLRPVYDGFRVASRNMVTITVGRFGRVKVHFDAAGEPGWISRGHWDIAASLGYMIAVPSHDTRPTDPLATSAEAGAA